MRSYKLRVLRCFLIVVCPFCFSSGCTGHPLPVQVEAWDLEEDNRSVFLTWDPVTHYASGAEIPSEKLIGYKVYHGPVSRYAPDWGKYAFEHDAGRLTRHIIPPILTGAKRWYFSATAYEVSDRSNESEYSDEVSKYVE